MIKEKEYKVTFTWETTIEAESKKDAESLGIDLIRDDINNSGEWEKDIKAMEILPKCDFCRRRK